MCVHVCTYMSLWVCGVNMCVSSVCTFQMQFGLCHLLILVRYSILEMCRLAKLKLAPWHNQISAYEDQDPDDIGLCEV